MPAKRVNIKRFQGVYYRVSDTRSRIDGKPDQCFDISYKDLRGKKIWEKIGWKSEGITAAYAAQIRAERMRNVRLGNENITIQQKKDHLITLEEAANHYFTWAASNTKSTGAEKSRYDLHIAVPLGGKLLQDITPLDLENLKDQLKEKNLKPKSIHLILSLIRTIYNKAIALDLYNGNIPTKRVIFPRINNRRLRFLSQKEAKNLLDAVQKRSPQLHDEALLSLHCGLRFGEIASLTWHDINFETEGIQIRDPKNSESRAAFMTPQVKSMLKRRNEELKKQAVGAVGKDDLVNIQACLIFSNENGSKQKEVSRTFDRVVDKLNFNKGLDTKDSVQRVVFHSLRHTFASWLALQGTPLYTIKELMGHKSIAMTERYSHLIPDHKKSAVNRMAKIFSETGMKRIRSKQKAERE
jgi:integrase